MVDVLVRSFEFQVKAAHLRSVASFFRKMILMFVACYCSLHTFISSQNQTINGKSIACLIFVTQFRVIPLGKVGRF